MATLEITDPDAARRYLLQSLQLSRLDTLNVERAVGALRWALELASEGSPLPLLGFICDFGHFLQQSRAAESPELAESQVFTESPEFTESAGASSDATENLHDQPQIRLAVEPIDRALARRYEDYVLGKLYADLSLERGIDALPQYRHRDRDRAIAFALGQVFQRAKLSGALIGPAVIKGLLALSERDLAERFENVQQLPLPSAMLEDLDQLIQCIRNCGELLGPEDIFELERGTALSQFGQRMALRQVLQAADYLGTSVPKQKPAGAARQYSVATNIHQEDFYPVGGFTSISNRGTLESLLRSELAYMDVDQRPDLFDIKYVRDELLYYSRDDNRFFRRRVCFMFVLDPNLAWARIKDPGATWQRIIYTLAALVVAVRSLREWLSADALRFEIIFSSELGEQRLADERALLETLFHEDIRSGLVEVLRMSDVELLERCERNAREALCHCTLIAAGQPSAAEQLFARREAKTAAIGRALPLVSQLSVANQFPTVQFDELAHSFEEESDPRRAALACLFEAWL